MNLESKEGELINIKVNFTRVLHSPVEYKVTKFSSQLNTGDFKHGKMLNYLQYNVIDIRVGAVC